MKAMNFVIDGKTQPAEIPELIVAGWAGRDAHAVEHHIRELEAIGVARPRAVPCFYRVSADLLTTDDDLEVVGESSSGEVEAVVVSLPQGLFVGVGSDHTDRKVEAYGVTVSKQMCPKPISKELWAFEDVRQHWDQLVLRSWVTRDGKRQLYQEGPVTRLRTPDDLMARYVGPSAVLPPGSAMFCGTLPVNGEIRGGELFEIEFEDPVLHRALRHSYRVRNLTIAD
ncbi:MAG: DUF2848 domain-containing protein [Pseudomonas sp.]